MFENKKVLILGLARSGYAAAKVLIEREVMTLADFEEVLHKVESKTETE